MSRSRFSFKLMMAGLGLISAAGLCANAASGGAVPGLTPHRAYVATSSHFRITFISHSANVIDAARAGGGGSQYIEGSAFTECPTISAKAELNPGYSEIVLRPVHGHYAFSLRYSVADVTAGYPGEATQAIASVSVHLTGTVRSAGLITGTIQVTGAPCSTPPYAYSARIDNADTKYIAPDA